MSEKNWTNIQVNYLKQNIFFDVKVKSLSHVRLFATPWTVTCRAPPSMGFSRQEYWSGLPFPSPGDLPNPGIEPRSSVLQADTLPSEPPGKTFYKSSTLEKCWNLLDSIGVLHSICKAHLSGRQIYTQHTQGVMFYPQYWDIRWARCLLSWSLQ